MEAKSDAGASELSKAIVLAMETSEGRSAAQEYVKGRRNPPSLAASATL